jgi:hypothetical protein
MVPKEDFEIIRKAHSWYLENRDNNRIDINKMIEIMNEQSPTILNHMIRQFEQATKKLALEKSTPSTTTPSAPPRMLLHGNKYRNKAIPSTDKEVTEAV